MFISEKERTSQHQFWHSYYSDELPVATVIPDYTNMDLAEHMTMETVDYTAEDAIFKQLGQYCKESDFLWYCFLLATLNVCLYKYTGERDRLVGSPMQGSSAQSGRLLPIHLAIDPACSFKEYVLKLREQLAAVYSHQQLAPNRMKRLHVVAAMEGLHSEIEDASDPAYIRILFNRQNDRLHIKFDYSPKRYKESTIRNLSVHYNELLQTTIFNMDRAICELSICSLTELEKIMRDFNPVIPDSRPATTLARQFEQQVFLQPDRIALVHNGRKLTYNELNKQANRLANMLRTEWNIQHNEFVAVRMGQGIEYIISILAILKAGSAYLPIDMEYPDERIHFILEDSQARFMLVQHVDDIPQGHMVSTLVVTESLSRELPMDNLDVPTKAEDLAYLLYTSGTTGQPKGVLIEQQNVLNLVQDPHYLSMDCQTVMLQATSIVFDLSTLEIWGTLLNGGTLVIVDKAILLEPKRLKETIREQQVNSMLITTALFHHLASHHSDIFSGIGQLLTGGEVLSSVLTNRILESYPDLRLVNGYGPTECTVLTTYYDIRSAESTSISIGKPISGTNVSILGVDDQIQPIGVPGELCISGVGVGRGYLNQPELTADRYVRIPGRTDQIMYRTGDLAYWREDGTIEFMGRKDRQLKLRGYRIELGEIENILLKHDQVLEAVVVPIKNTSDELSLCAYIVPEICTDELESQLILHLRKSLPDYMIPADCIIIERIPLKTNGKVDTDRLPVPDRQQLRGQQTIILPQTPEEQKVAAIWTEILGIQQISVHHNFFELGGHSLKLIILAEELQHAGYSINTMDLYKYPTIASFLQFQHKSGQEG
ncbi:amino acid adenylation domain-containing protein [Paenibacillus sp. cl6col]|uniref:non-ribosomal peptide synthetase n=1 Tax=Paenibacillus sp. cl6col TaxID=1761878 RepID=UPI000888ADC7|nr:non-ribosomal peptide synthetase [Paenibacillus sp. cl6col]SDG46300.1 amino acid adenylation domain-containing protein [Paenibacillus sp. cl6col]